MKKESKAKSVIISIICILVAVSVSATVVGIGSGGFKNWNYKEWFVPKEDSDVTYIEDVKPLLPGIKMSDRGVVFSTYTSSSGGFTAPTTYCYTIDLADLGVYNGTERMLDGYTLTALVDGEEYTFTTLGESDITKKYLTDNCLYHGRAVETLDTANYHIYLLFSNVYDISSLFSRTTVYYHDHADKNSHTLTLGIIATEKTIESFEIISFEPTAETT